MKYKYLKKHSHGSFQDKRLHVFDRSMFIIDYLDFNWIMSKSDDKCFQYFHTLHTISSTCRLALSDCTSFNMYFSDDRGMLELKRTTDYGKNIKTVASKIYSFGQGGRFLFASVMTGKVGLQLGQITS